MDVADKTDKNPHTMYYTNNIHRNINITLIDHYWSLKNDTLTMILEND
jgi:hypothetical protein